MHVLGTILCIYMLRINLLISKFSRILCNNSYYWYKIHIHVFFVNFFSREKKSKNEHNQPAFVFKSSQKMSGPAITNQNRVQKHLEPTKFISIANKNETTTSGDCHKTNSNRAFRLFSTSDRWYFLWQTKRSKFLQEHWVDQNSQFNYKS